MGAADWGAFRATRRRSCGWREEKGPREGEDLPTYHLCQHQCQGLGHWSWWAEQKEESNFRPWDCTWWQDPESGGQRCSF